MRKKPYSVSKIFLSLWMLGNVAVLCVAFAGQESSPITQRPDRLSLAMTRCPTDLSALQSKMQAVLQYVESASLRETLVASLKASIPKAIIQADGLPGQISFLKQEIVKQEQARAYAEKVARESLDDPSKPLVPCRPGEEGSYCHAMAQYYASLAMNMANRAFLEALECYQREGVR